MIRNIHIPAFSKKHLVFMAMFCLAVLGVGVLRVSAWHPDNPSIPGSLEHDILAQCPGDDNSPGQTIHYLYFDPAVINSPGGSGSTGLYATTVMCSNNNYDNVTSIHIFTTGAVTRTAGTGNVSLANDYYPPDVFADHEFAGPRPGTATFNNLSAGYNCWDIEYDAEAQHNGVQSNIPGTAILNLCVYYEPPVPPDNPYRVQGFRTQGPGSGTPFPDGFGTTTICGTNYGSNPYTANGLTGPCEITASASITQSGVTYDRVGYTMCFDRTDCHTAAPNPGSSVTVNLAGPVPNRYVDIYWHYTARDRPPTIDLSYDCTTQTVRVRVNDPDLGLAVVGYRIDGGPESWRVGNDFLINMAPYFQYDPHTVVVRTTGVTPLGGSGGVFVTNSIVYGRSPTRGCLDRGFVATATASEPVLLPDEENPSQVQFNSGVSVVITPGSSTGVRLTTERAYYIRRGGSVITLAPAPAPSPDTRLFNGNFTYPTATLNLPAIQVGDQVCVSLTVRPAAGTVDAAGNVITVTDNEDPIEECIIVLNKPYFQVFHGDISAGNGFETASCVPTTGRVRGFTKVNGGDYAGAGTQLGVFSRGQVQEFISASLRTVAPAPPKGLTLANAGSVDANSTYGGGITDSFCIPDYWVTVPSSSNIGRTFTLNGSASGRFKTPDAAAPARLNGGNFSGRRVVFSDGDLEITSDVTYNSTSWGSMSAIPNLVVIVRGNIYIDPSVRQLDGIYIAVPNGGTGGHIYTCSGGAVPSEAFVADECDSNRLTVYGQLIARDMHLLRTLNSLRDASPRDSLSVSDAAELFIESPEVWLSAPEEPIIESGDYDNIANLPPIL